MTDSPNINLRPITAKFDAEGVLHVGDINCFELIKKYGSPLWIIDYKTLTQAIASCQQGMRSYPNSQLIYAGKAFLSLAICQILQKHNLGLDVVSLGELYTAYKANFEPSLIYFHGNNKSSTEIEFALKYGQVNFIIDNLSELELIIALAKQTNKQAQVFFRVNPDIEMPTHEYIKTGHKSSKFGLSKQDILISLSKIIDNADHISYRGLHVHLGSQSTKLGPYLESVPVMSELAQSIKQNFSVETNEINLGGGVGIKYSNSDQPIPLNEWSYKLSHELKTHFEKLGLKLPKLILEPGRSLIGSAGITLYTVGHIKKNEGQIEFASLDGGMADNPRPAMYQAKYTAEVAYSNNKAANRKITIAGKYCESGDIYIRNCNLAVSTGDILAVYGTGAYNYSMSSNYNRTPRPACILVNEGKSDLIIKAENLDDLLRNDCTIEWLH